jgi:hypothetical protein
MWHPSFLSALFEALARPWPALIDDAARVDNARAADLRRLASDDIARIWPKLRLISCWGDGPARPCASELAMRVPGIELQPKGLLATEGIVTIPFAGRHPIAVRSHFFEFLAPSGRPVLAHQLQPDVDYSVVLVGNGADSAYVDFCVAQGQRLGNIKPVALHPGTGWTEVLPC